MLKEKDFHALRVDIKRIRAVLELIQSTNPKFRFKACFKPFSFFFKPAGEVRELQLMHSMINEADKGKKLTYFLYALDARIKNAENTFAQRITKKRIKRLRKTIALIRPFARKITAKKVHSYIAEKKEHVHALLQQPILIEADVHDLRKEIKKVFYLQKIFHASDHRFTIADDFQELLGRWHDGVVIDLDLQKELHSRELKSDEIRMITSVRRKITNRTVALFKTILTDRHLYLTSASPDQ